PPAVGGMNDASWDTGSTTGPAPQASDLVVCEEIWTDSPLPAAASRPLRTILCFASEALYQQEISEQLGCLTGDSRVIFVERGSSSCQISDLRHSLVPDAPEDMRDLFDRLTSQVKQVDAILYLWPLEDAALLRQPSLVLQLLQALVKSGLQANRLILSGAYENRLERSHLE